MSDENASRLPDEASAPAPWPGMERRRQRRLWPVVLVAALLLVLGLQLWRQLGQPPAGPVGPVGGVAGSTASGAGATGALGSAAIEPSPQLAQATETAARVARAASAALAAVRQRNEPPPPPERSFEVCDLGRLTVRLPPPPPPGNAAAGRAAAAGSAADGAQTPPAAQDRSQGISLADALAAEPGPWTTWSQPAGLPPALGVQARAVAWPVLLAALEAPGQRPRARAAALVLRATGLPEAERRQAQRAAAANAAVPPEPGGATASPSDPNSAPPSAPVQVQTQAQAQAQTQALAQLARLARAATRQTQTQAADATVLRWALALCARQARPGPDCRRLSARDLTRLAPDDAAGWLALAAQPGVAAGPRDAALERAAQAPSFSGLGAALAQQVDQAWPVSLPRHLRTPLLALALDLESQLERGAAAAWLQSCRGAALDQPATRARCDALARAVVARGPDLAWLGAARDVAQQLGWPDAERRALRNEYAALQTLAALPRATEQALDCPAQASTRAWVQGVAAQGELAWLRGQRAPVVTPPAGTSEARPVAPPASAPASAAGLPPR